jgi:prepilin-type N-terminal cleavage/methylation domain-containing protein
MASTHQRGFSLVEVTVAVAIVAVIAASTIAFALASRPTALWAATTQFDSMVSAARSIGAAYGDGATIFVSASPGPSNFRADLYAHRPSATASATPMPSQVQPIIAQVAINESQVLGPPPFAVIIHGNGDIGVRKNYTRGDPVTDSEIPCPASNQLVFVFTVNGQTATRTLPCHSALAYTGSTTEIPPGNPGATPTPWSMPSCDASANGCPLPPTSPATLPPCPAGTTLYNGVCRAPLVVTVNASTTAVNGQCAWVNTLSPCVISASEQYYPAPNLIVTTSSTGAPCTGNFMISNASGSGPLTPPNSYTGTSSVTWSIAPQALINTSCTLLVYDNRGPSDPSGSATLQITSSNAPGGNPLPVFSCSPSAPQGECQPSCINGTTCGVEIANDETTCESIGDGLYIFSHYVLFTYNQSTDGGSTWTTAWTATQPIYSSHASSCAVDTQASPGPDPTVPPGSVVDWYGSETNGGTPTWVPAHPPDYVVNAFG